jgi:hypothetical protein
MAGIVVYGSLFSQIDKSSSASAFTMSRSRLAGVRIGAGSPLAAAVTFAIHSCTALTVVYRRPPITIVLKRIPLIPFRHHRHQVA